MSTINNKILKPAHKAIFFDAGGTLLKPYPSVGEIYSDYAKKYGREVDPTVLNKAFYQVWNRKNGLPALQTGISKKEERDWWKDLVRDVFNVVGQVDNFDTFFDDLYYSFASKDTWKIFDEVFESLATLKSKGYYLGIISNWDHRLLDICKNLKLEECFDDIFVSAIVGFTKPDPRIFEKACVVAGILPSEAIHIGDSLTDDYYGAKNAGLDACFLDRESAQNIDGILAIKNFKALTV